LNLLKGFQNWRDCHWSAFKCGGRYAVDFSKENCSSKTNFLDFNTGHCQLSKALGATPRTCCSIEAKDLNSLVLKSF
jgi:hypothetical protein